MIVEKDAVLAAPPSKFEASVLAELEKLRKPKGNWLQGTIILLVSVMLFFALRMQNNPVAFTSLLIGVLFIHELGHYVGMRIFGYRNVRMFFIPMFGAAVSGQQTSAKSCQEAIVTLLGPMPGLCIAPFLFVCACFPGVGKDCRHTLIWVSVLFGLINGFNLLPIFPLDGGRLLNQVLFSRNRYLESVFLVAAALGLMAISAIMGSKIFLFLGIWMLFTVGMTFKTNSIAQTIRGRFAGPLPPFNEPVPMPILRATIDQLRAKLPNAKTPKTVASVTFRVWEKMHVQPPSTLATTTLLMAYALAGLLTLPWILPFLMTSSKHCAGTCMPKGDMRKKRDKRAYSAIQDVERHASRSNSCGTRHF